MPQAACNDNAAKPGEFVDHGRNPLNCGWKDTGTIAPAIDRGQG
jgi:hypothetical protein